MQCPSSGFLLVATEEEDRNRSVFGESRHLAAERKGSPTRFTCW